MARTNAHNCKLYNSNFIQHTSKCRTLKLGKQILKTGDTSHVLAQNSAAIVQLRDHESSVGTTETAIPLCGAVPNYTCSYHDLPVCPLPRVFSSL